MSRPIIRDGIIRGEMRFTHDMMPNFAGVEYDFEGREERLVIINCALQDCRANHPHANSVELASYIDAYLTRWERIRAAALPSTLQEEQK